MPSFIHLLYMGLLSRSEWATSWANQMLYGIVLLVVGTQVASGWDTKVLAHGRVTQHTLNPKTLPSPSCFCFCFCSCS